MAEATVDSERHSTLALKSFQRWRENRGKRDLKSAGNHRFANAAESIILMQKGNEFIKLRNASKKYPRTYFLDDDLVNICWTPSKKGDRARIPLNSLKEIREGTMSDAFSQCNEVFPEERCFSIIHGDTFVPLDLVASTREESVHWLIGLRYLMAKHLGEDELSQRQKARDQWLKETFTAADKSGDGLLSIEEVFSLMHKINVKISNKQLRETFKAADTNTEGLLDFQEFATFYKSISTRPELYMLLMKYGHGQESMGKEELLNFLKSEQGHEEVDKEYCKNIIEKHEPSESNRGNELLGIDGFTNYLLSAYGEVFNPRHKTVYQDMTKPLSHYFIASSHNTYLLGDQLTSTSSMDMYVRVLQTGCRCLEIDCWDGKDGEPVVYHGYTLTSKVKFRYIILNINDYAFAVNRYPLILSLENHCSLEQQKFMADFMKQTFKDKLVYADNYDDKRDLPSPTDLMGKILIKTKRLPVGFSDELDEGEVTEEDSADEMNDCFKFKSDDDETVCKMKERKCRRTLASLSRLRMNKEDDERDARGDLSSAIVSSVADEESTENSDTIAKTTPKLARSYSAKETTRQERRKVLKTSRSFSSGIRKKIKRRSKRSRTLSTEENDLRKTIRLSRQLSDLVTYTPSTTFKGLDLEEDESRLEVVSIPESKAYRYTDTKAAQFVKYTRCKLCRIFPAGYRIDSSNPNPQFFWNCGCQLVALNYQSDGRMLQINKGRFLANGNCGYILKPEMMIKGDSKFNPMSSTDIVGVPKNLLKIRVISGQQLPKPKDSILGDRGEIIDPYVEIECIGLPVDCVKQRTKTIEDNGFNPVWEESMVFLLRYSELTLIRIVVWDEDPIGRDFIGQFTLPFTSLMPGYRHIHLCGLDQATIFVHVSITECQGNKVNEIPDYLVKDSRQQSGGIKFKRRLMRYNSMM